MVKLCNTKLIYKLNKVCCETGKLILTWMWEIYYYNLSMMYVL